MQNLSRTSLGLTPIGDNVLRRSRRAGQGQITAELYADRVVMRADVVAGPMLRLDHRVELYGDAIEKWHKRKGTKQHGADQGPSGPLCQASTQVFVSFRKERLLPRRIPGTVQYGQASTVQDPREGRSVGSRGQTSGPFDPHRWYPPATTFDPSRMSPGNA